MTDARHVLPDLPVEAMARLRQTVAGEDAEPLFTSDLSVKELLLLDETGFEPLGLVVGSSIYHVGIQAVLPTKSRELDVLTRAMYHARELAMQRMEAEASALGADGVVGTKLDVRFFQRGKPVGEFMAIGTAVRHVDDASWRPSTGRPFTCDLSGQDLWMLLQTGRRPVALVMGSCVFHVGQRNPAQVASQAYRSVEMPNYTQAVYSARERAMQRMQAEALDAGAREIVGVRITERNHVWRHHAVEFFAVGTAVKRSGPRRRALTPTLTLGLDAT